MAKVELIAVAPIKITCLVCGQGMPDHLFTREGYQAALKELAAAKGYERCSHCCQTVPNETSDSEYRLRWNTYMSQE